MTIINFHEWSQTDQVSCRACRWAGPTADTSVTPYDAVMEVDCPACGARIFVVTYAAARSRAPLSASSVSFPDLAGDEIVVDWCFEQTLSSSWTVLRVEGQELWRETATWEGSSRLRSVVAQLEKAYGDRFASMRISPESELYLFGDLLGERRRLNDELTARDLRRDRRVSFAMGVAARHEYNFISRVSARGPRPEAFRAAWDLTEALYMAQTADTRLEYAQDVRAIEVARAVAEDLVGAAFVLNALPPLDRF